MTREQTCGLQTTEHRLVIVITMKNDKGTNTWVVQSNYGSYRIMDDDMFFWRRIYFIEKIRDFKSAQLFEQLVKAAYDTLRDLNLSVGSDAALLDWGRVPPL